MFGRRLHRLHEPRERRVAFASYRRYAQWTAVTALSLAVLLVGLDNMSVDAMLPLSDQLGAEGSALLWIDRAATIATWTWTATLEIGLVASDVVTLAPSSMPSLSSTSPSAAASLFGSW
jgi:hypothetical protein